MPGPVGWARAVPRPTRGEAGLVGVPVGSRVMLVIPPQDGYGSAGQASVGIKGTDTLVFVVDVLDAVNHNSG